MYLDLDADREVLEPIFAGSIGSSEIVARIEALRGIKIVPEDTFDSV